MFDRREYARNYGHIYRNQKRLEDPGSAYKTTAAWRLENPEKLKAQRERFNQRRNEKRAAVRATKPPRIKLGGDNWHQSARGKEFRIRRDATFVNPRLRMNRSVRTAFGRDRAAGREYEYELLEKLKSNPPQHCACCGKILDYTIYRDIKLRVNCPSLDRLNNLLGYTIRNTRVICWRCNRVKGKGTLEQLVKILAYVKKSK